MNATILTVDDDARSIDILRRVLEREQYVVRTARNGVEALAEIESQVPDLVLLDVTMPEMDGFEVCRRLRASERTQLLPVALLTGLDDNESRIRGLELGADDFINKPFERAVLLARIRSLLRVRRLTDQLESTERVIFTLASTVEARDPYTEGHLRRLAEYSHALALAYGCDPATARMIRYGGMLHDIGKIGISEAVLQKQGPLTDEEYEEMKRHPEIGAHIVEPMRFAVHVGPMILHHHERWDGRGYPRGIAGEAIPLGARIISVVDSYDAMITDRPYRQGLPVDEVVRRLRASSGSQWQSELVDTFIDLLERGELPDIDQRGEIRGA
ncbi:MAG TPA: HD domain-containing phosphohydrolase [Herpetosiphonaceae bacterium]